MAGLAPPDAPDEETDVSDLMRELAEEAAATPQEAPADKLERMTALAQQVAELDLAMADLQKQLADLAAAKNKILQNDMLTVMDEAGVSTFERGGLVFKTDVAYHASIPKEQAEAGCALLETERMDAGDLVKREVVVIFPKDAQEEAEALLDYVRKRYQMATAEQKKSVPWARLTSWYKERVQKGDVEFTPEDEKLLGASHYRYVKVEEAKAAKEKRRGR